MSARRRSLEKIAADVATCAKAWEPDACLIGNVRAHELAALAEYIAVACRCSLRTRLVGDGCAVCAERDDTP